MKAVIEFMDGDMTFIGACSNEEKAEGLIAEAYKQHFSSGSELVRMEYDGVPLYGVRTLSGITDEPSDIEYVDEDDNPLDADDVMTSDSRAVDEGQYEFSDTLWVIKDIDSDVPVNINASDYYLVDNPLERSEDLVVVTSL